jgi:2-keto-4-pentenoate hydratase/2-oxohepta-3-ene-1,7-dioic acid hydratase in catechol pathway
MRLANINGRAAVVSPDGRWVDVEAATDGDVSSDPMAALPELPRLASIEVPANAPTVAAEELRAPVPRPQKILGAGINYFLHAKEAGFDLPDQPLFFSKLPSAICGPTDPIVIPDGRGQVDWEAELVVVIGRTASRVEEADAWSYVAGLTAGQDISDREEQFRSLRQFTMGKSFDTFAPLGPVLVTPDEFTNRDDIGIRCWIDGELAQDGRTSDCIFSVAQLIAWVSQISTLEPGDLIFTGTPSGVGYIRQPPRFLAAGERLETEVEGIGRLENRCVAGPAYISRTYAHAEPLTA